MSNAPQAPSQAPSQAQLPLTQLQCFVSKPNSAKGKGLTPLTLLTPSTYAAWRKKQPASTQRWLDVQGFSATAGNVSVLPSAKGAISEVIVMVSEPAELWDLAALPRLLPEGDYKMPESTPLATQNLWALGWALGSYQFRHYLPAKKASVRLHLPKEAAQAKRMASAIYLARDLINMPANDCTPQTLAQAAAQLAQAHGAQINVVSGDDLIKENYPTIHMVGRASAHAPCLVDLQWGDAAHPLVTLVGKGVSFDTGGLDIKPSSGMLLMKKDMGGAACMLALAQMIMAEKMPVRLRLLIPAVENAIGSNAFRPGDVVRTRSGKTVEIGNTDAEGRLILCDALTEAVRQKPDVLIDFATLTGAARVALGTDMPALFSNSDSLAEQFLTASREVADPVWRLPLHKPYRSLISSKIADINNAGQSSFAGAITAALFLNEFVSEKTEWIHVDLMAWNVLSKPGRPEGGEAQAVRAAFAMLQNRYGRLG